MRGFGLLLVLLVVSAPAAAQTDAEESAEGASAAELESLWDRYDAEATRFEELQQQCEEGDRATTRVNRICREAADESLALADTIERLLELDAELGDDERELLMDGMLTNRQIGGALWVDLGECASGRSVLSALLDHPGLAARPVVLQATETWIARADACLAPDEEAMAAAPSRAAPIATLSAGLAILAGGVAWDLAEGGNRNEFDRLHDRCQDGCSAGELERLGELRDTLDRAAVPIAVLYGTGAAAAVGGVIWLAVSGSDRREREADVSFAPRFARDTVGGTVRVGW